MKDHLIPQYRKFNGQKQKVLMDEQYLFAYSCFDGFTHRLLMADFVVDYNYRCKIEVFANDIRTNRSEKETFYREYDTVPQPILSYMEQLLNADYQSLKPVYDYITVTMTGKGSGDMLINLGKETVSSSIIHGLPEVYFETEVEKLFFNFNTYMTDFFEQIYENEMLK